MNRNSDTSYYLVRTIQELVEKGAVGIGWSELEFDKFADAEEAIDQIVAVYGGIGRLGNQIRRFYAIAEGDVIVAPIPHYVVIGRATGGLFYDPADYDDDRANQRRVTFPRDAEGRLVAIPRTSFSEAFQRRLRVQGMTVNSLDEFADDIELALAAIGKGDVHSWVNHLHDEIAKLRDSFKRRLLENIQSGRTNLQTGGIGLENLVCELLRIEGYTARVLSKQHFNSFADADVQASRTDRCASVKLLVQVKHHQGYSNEYGINQLIEIGKAHVGEYDDHKGVFVTSATVSEEIRQVAENEGITVIGGADLVDWISELIDKLSKETKLALGIYEVPAVI